MITDAFRLFAKIFCIFTVIFMIILYFLAISLGPTLFYFTPQGQNISSNSLPNLPVYFLNIRTNLPIQINIGVLFLVIWSIFVTCFITAWKLRTDLLKTLKKNIIQPSKTLFNNSLFALPIINSMALVAILTIQNLQEVGGIPTGIPPLPGEPFLDLVDLSYAAIFEEIGFRLIPIGTFLSIHYLLIKKETTFSLKEKLSLVFNSFFFPYKAKKMVKAKKIAEHGILRGISIGEWGLILFTSIVFGLAHFDPGVSWEIGKITSATFAGFILGLSYVVYGIQASIIIHWFFNTYFETFLLLSKIYPIVLPYVDAILIITVILGTIGWLTLTFYGFQKLITQFNREKERNQINL